MADARLPWLKPAVATGGLLPLGAIAAQALLGNLGANPIAEVLNRLGLLTLLLLTLCLACTPLRVIFGWNWPIRIRKALGLLVFVYATLHFLVYALLDQVLDWSTIVADIVKRPFILLGFLAWLLLIPLAVTSTKKMVQRLGFRRWKLLHRSIYLIGGLGVLHFYMRVKKDTSEPLLYAGILASLLLVRAVARLRESKRRVTELPRPERLGAE